MAASETYVYVATSFALHEKMEEIMKNMMA